MCRLIVMGACPHDDQAQSSNWGIFNQHFCGDYDQHSQALLAGQGVSHLLWKEGEPLPARVSRPPRRSWDAQQAA